MVMLSNLFAFRTEIVVVLALVAGGMVLARVPFQRIFLTLVALILLMFLIAALLAVGAVP